MASRYSFLFVLLAVLVVPVRAQDHTVCASGCDFTTITAAIAAASNGQVIEVQDATHTEAGITVNKNLTIRGQGASSTTVQAAATRATAGNRVFTVNGGVTATIRDMTIRHGRVSSSNGGGIRNTGTLTLEQVAVVDNDDPINGNTIGGGGVFNSGTLTIRSSRIANNTSLREGGGLFNSGILTLENTTVEGNSAGNAFGGGLFNSGTLTIRSSLITNNMAIREGGALYVSSGTLTMVNTTVEGNSAGNAPGGGFFISGGTVKISHSTITGNHAGGGSGTGGGIRRSGGTVTLKNTILAGNTSTNGSSDCQGTITSAGHNLVGTTSGCGFSVTPGDRININANLDALANNGGPTQTIAMQAASLALDGGTCTDVDGNPVTTDQRGIARQQDGNTDMIGECDMGAYELVPSTPPNVLLSAFTATASGTSVNVAWTSLSETGSGSFEVQYRPMTTCQATAFTTVHTVSGAGNSSTAQHYSFTHTGRPSGAHQYRIRQVGGGTHTTLTKRAVVTGGTPLLTVCASNECEYSRIKQSLNFVAAGEEVCVLDAEHTEAGITVNKDLTIRGQAANATTIQAAATRATAGNRVFTIPGSATVTLTDMTIRHGRVSSGNGGGVRNAGTLTLEQVAVVDNNDNTNGFDIGGGGIFNSGTLTIRRSLVANNVSIREAGGIFSSGTLTLVNTTVDGNSTSNSPGGGFYITGGTVNISHSTITRNHANGGSGSGGGIRRDGGTVTLKNTILAGNTSSHNSPDCEGTIGSGGHNLIGSTSGCGYTTATADQVNVSLPLSVLPALADNGGPTRSRLPVFGSVLIEAGTCTDLDNATVTVDQRGFARPQEGDGDGTLDCDIGAVEGVFSGHPLNFIATPTSATTIDLTWNTPFERNNAGFHIQHHPGACGVGSFSDIGFVAGAGTVNGTTNYSFTASGLTSGDQCFRLRQVDGNNVEVLSQPVQSRTDLRTVCASGCSHTTLAAAIAAAGAGETIELQTAVHTEQGITINKNLTIQGLGTVQTILQASASYDTATNRVLRVTAASTVTLRDLTIRHGKLESFQGKGAGIYNQGRLTLLRCRVDDNLMHDEASSAHGGALYNEGTLTIDTCRFKGNINDASGGLGGAIFNKGSGVLTISNSLFWQNEIQGSSNKGGAIYANGTTTITNTTFYQNRAPEFKGEGAAIFANSGTMTINHSTISNNTATGFKAEAGGIFKNNATVTLRNTILANNSGDTGGQDCQGTITSADFNLIENLAGCTLDGTTTNTITGQDPQLTTFANHGGPTQTLVFQTGSPVIDAGTCTDTNSQVVATDQRGFGRDDGACDIGALEGLGTAPTQSHAQAVSANGAIDFNQNGQTPGVTVTFAGVSGTGTVTAQRFGSRPLNVTGISGYVIPFRWELSADGTLAFGASTEVCFDLDDAPLHQLTDPANAILYRRATIGTGTWTAMVTTYNAGTNQLCTTTDQFSEWTAGGTGAALPVELVEFAALPDGPSRVLLSWKTASETNNAGFAVEQLVEDDFESQWSEVGFVNGQGTTLEAQRYVFSLDDLEVGRYQFRLKQVDFDGTTEYSPEVEVTVELAERFVLHAAYPNPFTTQTTLQFAVREPSAVRVVLYDALGRRVQTAFEGEVGGSQMVRLRIDGATLGSGVYVARLEGEGISAIQRLTLVK
ncbi:MAG: choice-of-anchor Q domain-containing protein [Bacteroidota bacterium]